MLGKSKLAGKKSNQKKEGKMRAIMRERGWNRHKAHVEHVELIMDSYSLFRFVERRVVLLHFLWSGICLSFFPWQKFSLYAFYGEGYEAIFDSTCDISTVI